VEPSSGRLPPSTVKACDGCADPFDVPAGINLPKAAIARSLRGLLAFGVMAMLAVALQVSEALDTRLGLKGL
jgi:hypothetical protein